MGSSAIAWPLVLLKFWGPCHIFGISEAKHLKVHVLIDTKEYYCMHDKLPLTYGDVFGSCDLF